MNRVNFLDSKVAIQWNSKSDAYLEDSSIYWGTTLRNKVQDLIIDGNDLGDGTGVVLFDTSIGSPFSHSMFPN